MKRQFNEDDRIRSQRLAWLVLLLTAAALLTPGAVLTAAASVFEPAIEALRNWKNSWWPWPVSDSTSGGLPVDKIIHALLFAACGVLVSRAWFETLKVSTIILLLLAFALLTELAQYFIPGRGMSVGDIVADAVGVLAGVGIWQWIGPKFGATGHGET